MDAEIRPRRGDLADMAGIRTRLPETFLVDSRRSLQILDNRPFLPSNTDNVAIAHNPRSASARRLLALGDSFLRDNLPTLATFYRDIFYVRSDLFQPELLDLFAPDDVVTANAERYLARVRSDAEAESVVMRGYGREDYRPAAAFVTALRAQLSARAYPAVYRGWAERMAARTFDRLVSLMTASCSQPSNPRLKLHTSRTITRQERSTCGQRTISPVGATVRQFTSRPPH